MGGDRGREEREKNELRQQAAAERARADAAITKYEQPDEFEQRQREHVLNLDKWEKGELGPPDVRKMPGAGLNIAFFNEALREHDEGRIGRGYGSMSDGANPNFTAALDKELSSDRRLRAAGDLENAVANTLNAKDARMTGLMDFATTRNLNVANMREGRYGNAEQRALQLMLRPKQPSFLKQLALAAAGGTGTAVAGFA